MSQFPLQKQNSVQIVSCLVYRHRFEHLTIQWTIKYFGIAHLTFSGKSEPSSSFHPNWRRSSLKLDISYTFKWITYAHLSDVHVLQKRLELALMY